jgi:hypothetical protein
MDRRLRQGGAVLLAAWGGGASAAQPGADGAGLPPAVAGAASFSVRSWTVDDGTPTNTVMGAVRRAGRFLL